MSKSKKRKKKMGISEIGVAIPRFYIKTERMAEKELPSDYVNGGLGLIQARIPYKLSLSRLILKAIKKVKHKDVERMFLATESDYDASKAELAIKTIKNLKTTTLPFQMKSACLAGIQALISASEYCKVHKKPALVLIADRSIYKEKKAEVTQGAAAIALRIEQKAKLLALNIKNYGQYAEDIDDFRTPPNTAPFPKVNGSLTKTAYLKCVLKSFLDYKKKNPRPKNVLKKTDYFVMHTPFPKMVVWAAAAIWRYEKHKEKHFLRLIEESIEKPRLFQKIKKLLDEVREFADFKEFFKEKIEPGLKYNSYIGNCYNASIFISLLSALEQIKKGEKIILLGYGSGAGSITLKAVSQKSKFKTNLSKQIKKGQELTLGQYKQWKKNTVKKVRNI